jgi:Putative Ig domain/Carboxypeptidase regulatory-like domain
MRKSAFAFCALFLLLTASASRAQQATLSGTVTDATTLGPLFGGRIADVAAYNSAGVISAQRSTDSAGHYQMELPPGTYLVKVVNAPGYVLELHDDIACVAADCPVTAGTPVVLTAGNVTTIDFALSRGRVFVGTVKRASDDSGISGLDVYVYNASTSLVGVVTTGAGGLYFVDGLTPGTYFARVAFPSLTLPTLPTFIPELYGGLPCPAALPPSPDAGTPLATCRIGSGAPITVTTEFTTTGIDFSLDRAGSIYGSVGATTGQRISTVIVKAYLGDIEAARGVADATGHYVINGLPPGAYRVRTEVLQGNYVDEWYGGVCVGCPGTPTPVIVGAGQDIGPIDFSLAAGGSISGRITCQGLAPTDWLLVPIVYAYSASGVLVRSTPSDISRACSPMNPTFTYLLEGLAAGQYYLLERDQPNAPGGTRPNGGDFVDELFGGIVCMTQDCDVRRGAPVTVTAGSITGVDLIARRGLNLGPLLSPAVHVYDARGIELVSATRFNPVSFNAYEIVGLPPGTYYVKVRDVLNGGIICPDCPPTVSRPIIVKPGASSLSLDFTAAAPNTRVRGTVRAATTAAPLSTVRVELFSTTGTIIKTAVTDLFGNYVLDSVLPGTYFLRTANDRGYSDETYNGLLCTWCDPRLGTPVTVTSAADVTGIDFTLALGGDISGTVTDTAIIGIGEVPVSLFTATGTLLGRRVSTATGQFSFTVPAGSYRARAEATQGHGGQTYDRIPCTSGSCDVTSGTPISVSTGATTGVNFTLASCTAMTLSPSSLATGVRGDAYRQTLSVTGGIAPFTFTVTSGALPLGLSLDRASGVLSGAPSASGRHEFRVGAVGANGCAAANAYTLDVQACAFVLSPSRATVAAAGGTARVAIVDACGSQTVANQPFWIHVLSNTTGEVVLTIDPNPVAAPRTATLTIDRRAFEVRQAGTASQPPFGVLDAPFDGQQVTGAIAVGGWALDDLEVARVRIYRDPVSPEPPGIVYLGTAVFIPGARPDVQRAFPSMPLSERAGWGFLILTNTLPNQGNGGFRIHAVAEDVEGQSTLLGSRTIFGFNAASHAPFGTIDTPGQGETIAGAEYLNWGWALTPQPAMIPFDGSTIQVLVDGAPVGPVNYNFFRSDVSGIFPGLKNSGGPVGYRILDTTSLAEGLHTISWVVTDDLGATSGLGSRYFAVANSAEAQVGASQGNVRAEAAIADAVTPALRLTAVTPTPTAAEPGPQGASVDPVPLSDTSVTVRRDGRTVHHAWKDDAVRALVLAPMERLEIQLGTVDDGCSARWSGFLIKDSALTELPVGSSLDPAGIFYWQTGPGFAGRFDLLFLRTDCNGHKQRLPLSVMIARR